MCEWDLYLDESGNTGTNMLDENQPFYVYAGWLVKKSDENDVVSFVKESFKIVKSEELKSINIIRRYRPQLYSFLQNSIKNGMYPFYYVFEKKHYICCKIVETFFDYAHNSNVPMDLTFDFDRKKKICDALYENEDLLKKFSRLLVNSTVTIDEMNRIKELLANSMNTAETFIYKDMISNVSIEELYSMISEFECVADGNNKIRQSPGGTELFSLMNELEKLMKITNETVTVVADELKNTTFLDDLREIICNHSLFTKVVDIKIGESKKDIMLQAADLLSGFIDAIYKNDPRIMNDEETKKIIIMFDAYNKKFLEANVCPLNFSIHYDNV